MKRIIFSVLAAAAIFAGCSKSDYEDLKQKTDDLAARVTALEDLQTVMWENIQALQAIVNGADFDYVTGVKALEDGSGYEITFKKNPKIIIRHGSKGEAGQAPLVSVKQDVDGEYYWTLNGEWLLDGGNKIPARGPAGPVGPMGPAGISTPEGVAYFPMMRINETTLMWELSTDGGATWTSTNVVASGEGESVFAQNGLDTSDPNFVTITLKDGTSFKLPRYKGFKIGSDEGNGTFNVSTAETLIPLTMPSGLVPDECVAVIAQTVSTNGTATDIATKASESTWGVKVRMPTFSESGRYNNDAAVNVTLPEGIVNGEKALLRITVVDACGSETVFSRVLEYKEEAEAIPAEAGYYYFSDGTWAADLDAGKTCVGIVFYVGDVAKDDEELMAKIGSTASGTHGLVAALKDLTPTIWMKPFAETGVSSNLNLMNGYSNTLRMNEWDSDDKNISNLIDIQIKMAAFVSENPAPETSSGWYLPSVKELSTLCTGWRDDEIKNDWKAAGVAMRTLVDEKLLAAGGEKFVSEGGQRFYWSSTGIKTNEHMSVGFDGGVVRDLTSNDATNPRSARMILAF